jgi:hypothetical protein
VSLANERPNRQHPDRGSFSAHDETQASQDSFWSDAAAFEPVNSKDRCRSTVGMEP